MIVAVTGGRNYGKIVTERTALFRELNAFHAKWPITLLVHGACPYGGADPLAEDWARTYEIDYRGYPAKFNTGPGGGAEGPKRNRRMLVDAKPGVLIAFPGGSGTNGTVAIAAELGIPLLDLRGVT